MEKFYDYHRARPDPMNRFKTVVAICGITLAFMTTVAVGVRIMSFIMGVPLVP